LKLNTKLEGGNWGPAKNLRIATVDSHLLLAACHGIPAQKFGSVSAEFNSITTVHWVTEMITEKECRSWNSTPEATLRYAQEPIKTFKGAVKISVVVLVGRGVTRLDGAGGKKQVWRPHV